MPKRGKQEKALHARCHHSPSYPIDEFVTRCCPPAAKLRPWKRFAEFGLEQGCRERHAKSCRSVRWKTIGRCSLTPGCSCRWERCQPIVDGRLQKTLLHFLRLQGTRFSSDHCVATLAPPALGAQSAPSNRCRHRNQGRKPLCQVELLPRCPKREDSPAHPIRAPFFPPSSPAAHPSSYPLFCSPSRRQPYTLLYKRTARDSPILQTQPVLVDPFFPETTS